MKALAAICCAAVLAWSMAGCKSDRSTSTADTHDADVKALGDTEAQWNNDFGARDLEKIASHYAEDAVVMTPGAPAMKGKDTIHKGLQEMLADPAMTLQFHANRIEVSKSGDLGYSQGAYTMKMTDPQTHKVVDDHGSYVTTYRKQADGSWKVADDIATSEVPPMPAMKM
jgi:uncharacterized protein (TIGR02246 family)